MSEQITMEKPKEQDDFATSKGQIEVSKIDDDVFVIILLPNNEAFKQSRPFDLEVCGRPMHAWVNCAIGVCPNVMVQVDQTDDIISIVKNNITDYKYTAVLYADTPLLTRKTFLQIIDYVKTKKLNVCKLTRGFVFETKYIKNADKIYSDETHYFDEEDFIAAFNFKQLALIRDIQRNRILEFWMSQGVDIAENVYIDADVNIGQFVRVNAGASLLGATGIGDGAIIGRNVVVKDSIIGAGVKVDINSVIKNAEIGNHTQIGVGVVFCNYNGKTKSKSIVGSRVFIGSNCNLIAPITLEDGSFIAAGSTISDDVPADTLAIARARQVNKTK